MVKILNHEVQSIYVAGPMSGYKNFNYDAFNDVAESLRGAGYTVLNPAEFQNGVQSKSWHDYMRFDINVILTQVDALVLLPGWETSEGANVEITVARAIGLPVWDSTDLGITVKNNPKSDDIDDWATDHPDLAAVEKCQHLPYSNGLTAGIAFAQQKRPAGMDDRYWNGFRVGFNHEVKAQDQALVSNGYLRDIENDLAEAEADLAQVLAEQDAHQCGGAYVWDEGRLGGIAQQLIRQSEKPEQAKQAVEEMRNETILEEAQRVVNGPRRNDYDHPLDNFYRIARMWSVILSTPVSEEQHALCMIAVKIARLMNTPDHRDSITDIAGYAQTIELLQKERALREGVASS